MCESSRKLSPVAKKKLKELKDSRRDTIGWYENKLYEVDQDAKAREARREREFNAATDQMRRERDNAHELLAEAINETRRLTSYVEAMRNALIHEIAATGPRTEG